MQGILPHLFATAKCGFVIVGAQFEHIDKWMQTHSRLRYQQPRLKASYMTLLGKVNWRSQPREYK